MKVRFEAPKDGSWWEMDVQAYTWWDVEDKRPGTHVKNVGNMWATEGPPEGQRRLTVQGPVRFLSEDNSIDVTENGADTVERSHVEQWAAAEQTEVA